jgi:cytoskeleton protein RodZ
MTSEAGGENVRGIGARLRAARERRGLTVLQAAEKLHVDARILEALEAQDFAVLGAEVYVRGHLRRYAEAVGESPAQLQEQYVSTAQAARPDLTRIPRGDSANRSSRLLLPALLVVVGFALAGLLWWLLTLPVQKGQPLADSGPGFAAGTAAAAVAAPGSTDLAAVQAGGGTVPTPSPAGGVAPMRGAQGQLNVRFAAISWVEISDADGRRLLTGLFARGSTRDVSGRLPLRVVLGNAPAVDLQLNGQPVTFAGLVHRNGSAHLLIDGAGRASAAAPRLAHGY